MDNKFYKKDVRDMYYTKGQMIKQLKQLGIRRAEKEGYGDVQLEHLKYYQVCNLWQEHCGNE